jgi:hypothetical protein
MEIDITIIQQGVIQTLIQDNKDIKTLTIIVILILMVILMVMVIITMVTDIKLKEGLSPLFLFPYS